MSDEVRGWLSPKAVAAEAGVSQEFDLSQCVREPIHLLGGVQSYGALVAARLEDAVVDTVSRNAADVLGRAAEELAGRPVTELIGEEQWALARESMEAGSLGEEAADGGSERAADGAVGGASGSASERAADGGSEWVAGGPAASGVLALSLESGDGRVRLFDVTVHRVAELLVLEFEPRSAEAPFVFQNFYPRVRRALHRLQGATGVTECCAAAVREVQALTGYDRVVAYRFDGADGPGQVIAEARNEGREPWLGLWFPATDIPPQARRLYARNWIRVIGDVDDATVGLLPELREGADEPLDLSGSILRTVSGYHLEYLRNIGVASSMSVSLLHDGELWGLIACHGDEPRRLTPEVRAACEFFGIALSLQLAAVAEREQADELSGYRRALATLLARLSSQEPDALLRPDSGLAELLCADGALLVRGRGTEVSATGDPVPAALPGLLERLAGASPVGEVWSSDRVPEVLGLDPAEAEEQGLPAGLLFLPFNRDGDLLAWWRREQPAPREWAADPARPVRTGPGGERLTPRGSAAVHRATVRGRSTPWTPAQRAVAGELWREMAGLLSRQMAELAARNTELARTNEDLDSFAHAAAHDLKEPLRGISNAAAFMVEDAGDVLDATSLRRLTTVRRLAERMDGLLDSLLHFSRLGQVGLEREELSLDEVVDDALLVAGGRLAEQGVTVVRPAPLPRLRADRERLREVLENLFVNAAKYAADEDASGERRVWVEAVPVAEPGGGEAVAVVVRDNGIGIPPGQQEDVLQLFRRLHRREERGGGSGVGLAVVKRIVERHGGRLWLESPAAAPDGDREAGGGPGTAVWFTLGAS